MAGTDRPTLGRRIYMALFKIMGPADVGPLGPPAVPHPNDPTVPAGYHLETRVDGAGYRRRVAVPDTPDR